MQLSVIIVNYNVRYFLEQCLGSVIRACQDIDAEIFVVDNNSVDGSANMVQQRFPQVKLILNQSNLGFSRANNQAIRLATGTYTLLLNPDTVVEEHCFQKCIAFMEAHPEAGALGIKMIDGKGRYLPESKRSFPTPAVAFYKIFGLSAIFPRSKRFGKYHLSYLDKDQTHEIDVLSGAFMFMRTIALLDAGMLDEAYFMYGEDIDLSYSIKNKGYRVYYYPGAAIIHYKGESTKKASLNYVFTFYQAMLIFANKHMGSHKARLFSLIIKLAIYSRAFFSVINRVIRALFLPLLDFVLIYAGYLLILPHWEHFILGEGASYPPVFMQLMVPAYILIWLAANYYTGTYDKPIKTSSLLKGFALGTVIILVAYALLPVHLRFSRALIIIGAIWGLVICSTARYLLHISLYSRTLLSTRNKKRTLIVGEMKEAIRVKALLEVHADNFEIAGIVSPRQDPSQGEFIGSISQLPDIVRVNEADEIIFCASDVSSRDIIQSMLRLDGTRLEYKIAPQESISIIGSNSAETSGDIYTLEFNLIVKPGNRRVKRLFDFSTSLVLLILSPVIMFIYRRPARFLANAFKVLTGSCSWVGYHDAGATSAHTLPVIRRGILNPLSGKNNKAAIEQIEKLNILYAKDYSLTNDLKIFVRGFTELDSDLSNH